MGTMESICRAHTFAADARVAASDFHAAVAGNDPAMVLFFCSSDYDLDALADELQALFGDGADMVNKLVAELKAMDGGH